MPVLNLTARVVESLKPPADKTQIDYFDSNVSGFGLRISKDGKKTWILLFRVSNSRRLRRLSLGRYPALSLADAREKAKTALAESTHGKDPAEAKKEGRRAETFAELADQSDRPPEIDHSLIMLNLSLSYEERIRRHDEAARLAEDLRQAGKAFNYA